MKSLRNTMIGVLARAGARWIVESQYPVYSPRRIVVIAVLNAVPPRVLGFVVWWGARRYVRQRTRVLTHPTPAVAGAVVAAGVTVVLARDAWRDAHGA